MTKAPSSIENELDIRKLFHILWCGKLWIIGFAVMFAAMALIYSYVVKQEWVSVATVTKPSVTMLNGYYEKQRLLISLTSSDGTSVNLISDDVYRNFLQQLDAYDTKRDFWLQSHYYLTRTESNKKADAALLYQFIDNIRLVPSKQPSQMDNIQLIAETAEDAQQLLVQYIQFAAKRSVDELNQELVAQWTESLKQYSTKIEQQQLAVEMNQQKQVELLKQVIAQYQSTTEQTNNTLLFKELETLINNNLLLDQNYYQNQVISKTLSQPPQQTAFQPYRFLRTPDEPITRSKPRRLFLLILWGGIGVFCGIGVALLRYKNH